MPEFMVMILENEAEAQQLAPSATMALVEGQAEYERRLRAASAYVDGERLRPSSEGRRVGNRDGVPRIDAGPFGDQVLGGYHVLEAEGLDAAVALAEACPASPGAELEVRPVMKGRLQPGKTSHQGRVFAFAVLGNAPTEQAWIDIMDRFDASSRDGIPADQFLGGVRLHEPGRGRRVIAAPGGRRAVLDGPFLESKEVIGGVFFLRMRSLDEAVAWASRSELVKHAVVEIRELWRS